MFTVLPIYDLSKDANLLKHTPIAYPVVVYHHPCIDGIGAAYIAWKHFKGECLMLPWSYGKELPALPNREVYFVDICPTFQQLANLLDQTSGRVTIIDHHMDRVTSVMQDWETAVAEAKANELDSREDDVVFDTNKDMSGCMLAFEHFGGLFDPHPMWVQWTSDGDLWHFHLPDTIFFRAYAKTVPLTLRSWEAVTALPEGLLISMGKLAEAAMANKVEALAKTSAIFETTKGVAWACCNADGAIASELGSHLCSTLDIALAVIYQISEYDGTVKLSIRSRDISAVQALPVAKLLGGGGHPNAAGCQALPIQSFHQSVSDAIDKAYTATPQEDSTNAPE